MADEFQAAAATICGDNYWWNNNNSMNNYSTRTMFPLMMMGSTCSVAANNDAAWQSDFMDLKPTSTTRSCSFSEDEDNIVNFAASSLHFLDPHNNIKLVSQHHHQQSESAVSAGTTDHGSILIDSTLQMMGFGLSSSPSSSNWNNNNNHSLFHCSSNGRPENNFHSVIQEETGIDSSNNSLHQIHSSSSSGQVSTIDAATNFKPIIMNQQEFSIDQQSLSSVTSTTGGIIIPNIGSASYCNNNNNNYPSTMMQGLYEPDPQPEQQNNRVFRNPCMSYNSSSATTWSTVSSLMKPPKQQQQQQQQQQQLSGLHFSNNTPFWNDASTESLHDIRAAVFSSSQIQPQPQYQSPTFDDKPNCPKAPLNNKLKREESPEKGTASAANRSGSEAAFKKPRIETPSPLPTFKVRKEKLGDRITALQQLVSPFGKTDTASVLHEAIEYIKFLHDQVNVLSTPYTKNGTPIPHNQEPTSEGGKQDLRSRGLCLVPISSTFPMANETTADFWTPTFGGGPLIGSR